MRKYLWPLVPVLLIVSFVGVAFMVETLEAKIETLEAQLSKEHTILDAHADALEWTEAEIITVNEAEGVVIIITHVEPALIVTLRNTGTGICADAVIALIDGEYQMASTRPFYECPDESGEEARR